MTATPRPATPTPATRSQIPPHLSAVIANVDGAPATIGSEVTAWMDGQQVASGTVKDGVAIIVIFGDQSFIGKTIYFKIGTLNAVETDFWEQGGHVNPELRISAFSAK